MITSQQEAAVVNEIDEEEGAPLPGFRFHPTDEELVSFYLKRKVEKKPLSIEIIRQIDLYKYDPWDLAKVGSGVGDKEWYFYCKRGRKYKNSLRPNRVTGSGGFWKATGIDRPIFDSKCIIGLKKSLVYYRGSAGKGTKTEWMMHEFRLPQQPLSGAPSNHPNSHLPQAEIWTLCRILKRNRKYIPADRRDQLLSKRVAITNDSPESNNMKEHYISFAKPSTQQQQQQQQQQQILHYDDHECINAFGNHGMELVRRKSEEKIIESTGKVYSNANPNTYYDIKEQRMASPLIDQSTPMELASNFSSPPLHPSTSADQLDQGDDHGYGGNYWWDAIGEIYS